MKNPVIYTYESVSNQDRFIEANCEISGRGIIRHGNVNPTTILFTATAAAFAKLEKAYTILTK